MVECDGSTLLSSCRANYSLKSPDKRPNAAERTREGLVRFETTEMQDCLVLVRTYGVVRT